MIVYGSPLSPFVRKTLAYISEKGLQVDVEPVGLGSRDPAFREASPFGKIPGFRDGDFTISDSTAIITYLEAKHPEPVLIPADPASRARTIWYEEFGDTILVAAAGKVFFNRIVSPRFLGRPGDEALVTQGQAEMGPLLAYLERVIPASGFLVDDRFTLADIAVASPFVNLSHCGIEVVAADHPKLAAYLAGILARPSFAPMVAQEKAILAA